MIKSSIYTTYPFLDSVTVKLSEVVLSQGTNPLQSEIIFYCNPILEDVIDPSSIGKKKLITDGCETGCSSSLIDRKPVRQSFLFYLYVLKGVFTQIKRICLAQTFSVGQNGLACQFARLGQTFVWHRRIIFSHLSWSDKLCKYFFSVICLSQIHRTEELAEVGITFVPFFDLVLFCPNSSDIGITFKPQG